MPQFLLWLFYWKERGVCLARKGKSITREYDITINQGDDYPIQLVIKNKEGKPVDITDNEYVLRVRENAQESNVIIEAKAKLLYPEMGIVEFHFDNEDTALIPTEGEYYSDFSKYTYDIIQITPNGDVTRLLNGFLFVSPGISYH